MNRKLNLVGLMTASLLIVGAANAADPAPQPERSLDSILKQKVDVNFWRHYLPEVLDTLGAQTGLHSAYPATLDTHICITLQQKGMTVATVLDAVASMWRLQIEHRGDRVLVWQRVDDKLFDDTVNKLKDADRWKRCDAVYDLGQMSDPRIYAPLLSALQDSNPQVAAWALDALSKHVDVLPYIELKDREVLVKAIEKKLSQPNDGNIGYQIYGASSPLCLLAAANTPSSVEILKGYLANDKTRGSALGALAYSGQPAALALLLDAAKSDDAAKALMLIEPLRRADCAQSAVALIRMAKTVLPPAPAGAKGKGRRSFGMSPMSGGYGGPAGARNAVLYLKISAWSALSRMDEPAAQQAVDEFLKNYDDLAALAEQMYRFTPRTPQAADALTGLLKDGDEHIARFATLALALIGDARALDAVQQRIGAKDDLGSSPLLALCSIRGARAEAALIKLCKQPPPEPENPQMMGMGQKPDWLGAMVRSRDSEVAESFMEMIKDPNSDLPTRTRLEAALINNLQDRQEIAKLNDLLLASDAASLEDLVLQTVNGGSVFDYSSPGARPSFFASDARWTGRLTAMLQQTFEKVDGGAGGFMSSGALTTAFAANNGRIQLIHGNPAVVALEKINSPAAVRAIVAAFSSTNDEVRQCAVEAGAQLPEPARADPERIEGLAARLNDPVAAIKTSAIHQLAMAGDKRAVDPLKESIKNPPQMGGPNDRWETQRVRWESARLLLETGDEEVKAIILAMAEDPKASYSDGDVRNFGDVNSQKTADILRAILNDKKVPADRREQAASALYSGLKDKEALAVLFEILKTPFREGIVDGVDHGATDWNSHSRIVQALQQDADPAINAVLADFAADTDIPLKLRAFTLKRMSGATMDEAALAKFKALSADEQSPVDIRVRAASMLCGSGTVFSAVRAETPPPADVLKSLVSLYKDKPLSAESSRLACNVLAGTDDAAALRAVADNLKSDNPQKKFDAATALAQVRNDAAAVDALLELVKDGPMKMREQAHGQLQGMLMDWNKTVPAAIKEKIKQAFEEINKAAQTPQKPPPPPADF